MHAWEGELRCFRECIRHWMESIFWKQFEIRPVLQMNSRGKIGQQGAGGVQSIDAMNTHLLKALVLRSFQPKAVSLSSNMGLGANSLKDLPRPIH